MSKAKSDPDPPKPSTKDVVDGEDVCPVCGRKGRPPGHH